jgi:hypothetical protein
MAAGLLGAAVLASIIAAWQLRQLRAEQQQLQQLLGEGLEQTEAVPADQLTEAVDIVTRHRPVLRHLLDAAARLRSNDPAGSDAHLQLCRAAVALHHDRLFTWLVLGLGVALLSGTFLTWDMVRAWHSDGLRVVIAELSRVVSGRVAAAISYHHDITGDVSTTKQYLEILESKKWSAVRRFADEQAMPAVLENLTGSLEELGPILADIDHDLKALLDRFHWGQA